jgi:uncharacterized membrane protein YcaP (DUF421 family)
MNQWMGIVLRSVTTLLLLFIIMRMYGRKTLAKITPFTMVYFIVIGVIAAAISLRLIRNITLGFLAIAVWFFVPFILEYGALKSKKFHDFVYGKELVLIRHGKVMEENLIQARLTPDDLLKGLRTKNILSVADVEFAVMELDGEINIFEKSDRKPLTAKDMNIEVPRKSEPQTVILDGNVIDESLSNSGLNRQWLNQQLESRGVSLENVFIGQVDSAGDLTLDLFDDTIKIKGISCRATESKG